MASRSDYDAIIVGAGIGGLTTGCLLAKTGHRVLILEQHFKVGGFVTSYQRKHYPMDVVHAIGGLSKGAAIDRIFSFLNLYDRLCFNEIEKVFIYRFPECNIDCYTSIARYQDELKRHFPDQSSSVEQIFAEMSRVWQQVQCSYYNPSLRQLALYPLQFPKLVKYQNWSFEKFLGQFTEDYRLKKVLSAGWGYNGLNMSRISATYMIGMLMSYHTGGAWYPRGGYQNLSDTLADIAIECGGEIKTKTAVEKIIIDCGRAVGVRTRDGSEYYARSIVSNADTKKTFLELVSEPHVPKRLRRKVAGYKQSVSGFVVHLVVDMEIPKELSCGCIMYFPDYDTDEHQFKLWEQGKMELDPDSMGLGISVATLRDEGMVPDGRHVLDLIYMPAPFACFKRASKDEYLRLKEEISQNMVKAAEKVIPELADHIVVRDISTPLTYERYTGATEGGWYDIDCSPRQANLGRIRNKTPINGLYLTGAKTYPGSGMFGSIQAGLFTADSILNGRLTQGRNLLVYG
jgi:phytoene dehydrogenase-like protein